MKEKDEIVLVKQNISLISVMLLLLLFSSCSNTNSLNEPDRTPPTVWMTYPKNGDSVPVGQREISAIFHEKMDNSTISNATFFVHGLTGSVSANDQHFTHAFFVSDADLEYSTTYIVTIKGTVRDISGNAMGQDYVWTFSTHDP